MTPRRTKLFAALVLFVITAILLPDWKTEPGYGGHSLSHWVEIYTLGKNTDEAKPSDEALRQIGTNAIPRLLQWISREPPQSKMIMAINVPIGRLNRKLDPRVDWTYEDPSRFRKFGVIRAFKALGNRASSAIPKLTQLLNQTNNFETMFCAAQALGYLGPLALEPLTAALTNANAEVRAAAAISLSNLGTNAEPAIPVLIQSLDDKERDVRQQAYEGLQILKLKPELVVPALIAHLTNENPCEITLAATVLSAYGSLAQPAVPVLLRALEHASNEPDPFAREKILNAIRQIDPESSPILSYAEP